MKATFENVESKKGDTAFVAYHSVVPYFEFKWHYHPEYELTLITNGEGKRLVGDSYENFGTGDLVLLGSGLPHTWVSDPVAGKNSSAIVIQFSTDFIGGFLKHSEFAAVGKLLELSAHGLHFPAEDAKKLIRKITTLPEKEGVIRITALLEILQELSQLECTPLASAYFTPARGKENEVRINKVCRYIQLHSAEAITLQKAAYLIHLSPGAFCKFFKRVTGKTFSDYVNDIRIGNACQLLTETDATISAVAFASGFESLTYFNRVFRRKKDTTPVQYRKSLKAQQALT
ncbi:MAG: AraC family transcriptional regulator [Flavobacterium sp.]